jgi:DNA-binding NtrC family response regulator
VSDEAVRNLTEMVGSATLKDIVAETTDVVEKMCIETAVDLTRNNRVAAAEMLGLSRQSLYVKAAQVRAAQPRQRLTFRSSLIA